MAELRAEAAALRAQRLNGLPWHAADAARLEQITAEIRALTNTARARGGITAPRV